MCSQECKRQERCHTGGHKAARPLVFLCCFCARGRGKERWGRSIIIQHVGTCRTSRLQPTNRCHGSNLSCHLCLTLYKCRCVGQASSRWKHAQGPREVRQSRRQPGTPPRQPALLFVAPGMINNTGLISSVSSPQGRRRQQSGSGHTHTWVKVCFWGPAAQGAHEAVVKLRRTVL